jgi:predicted RNase H-like HicB family nuclease
MNLDMTVHIYKEGAQYVAHAMPLDVMSSGGTPEAARQALDEAVRAFLLTASDIGTLEQVLEESGRLRFRTPGGFPPDLRQAWRTPAGGDPDL